MSSVSVTWCARLPKGTHLDYTLRSVLVRLRWSCSHGPGGKQQARGAGKLSLAVDEENALRGNFVAGFETSPYNIEVVA